MIFDRLCGIIEAHYPIFVPLLRKAKLFEIPIVPHEDLPKTFEGDIDFFENNFFLPFSVVAVEDNATCIILFDLEKDQKGTKSERGFIECLPLNRDIKNFKESLTEDTSRYESKEMLELHNKGYAIVSIGVIDTLKFWSKDKFSAGGGISVSMVASKRDILLKDLHKGNGFDKDAIAGTVGNAYTAMQEIVYLNQPTNFILKETPLKKKKGKTDKVARSHERPKYTILSPNKIREKMELPKIKGTHASPIPHERRRHDRWLSDIRYAYDEKGEKRIAKPIPYGKRKGEPYFVHVDVPATWIGLTENTVGNKHYKVLIEI